MLALLVFVIVLTIWHTVWDGILAPSFRAKLRFDVFRVRDQIRALRAAGEITSEAFRCAEDSINTAIGILPAIGVADVVLFERVLKKNETLRRSIEERRQFLAHQPQELRDRLNEVGALVNIATAVNCGAWLVPLVSIIVPAQMALMAIRQMLTLTRSEIATALPYTDCESGLAAA